VNIPGWRRNDKLFHTTFIAARVCPRGHPSLAAGTPEPPGR
jgi:hypothetical protein